jgi:hypothetical protein
MEGFWGYWVLGWEARPPPSVLVHPWTSASLGSAAPGHPDARLHHQFSQSRALALTILKLTLVIGP